MVSILLHLPAHRAIDTTIEALKAAVTKDAKIIRFELEQYDADNIVQVLAGACTKIKKCFDDFGVWPSCAGSKQ